VGANYRAACRSRSKAEFIARLGVVEEEADESGYWMELIVDSGLMKLRLLQPLLTEANELVAIMVSSRMTAATNRDAVKLSTARNRYEAKLTAPNRRSKKAIKNQKSKV
jgi:23S rRNA-intervening sequence protein